MRIADGCWSLGNPCHTSRQLDQVRALRLKRIKRTLITSAPVRLASASYALHVARASTRVRMRIVGSAILHIPPFNLNYRQILRIYGTYTPKPSSPQVVTPRACARGKAIGLSVCCRRRRRRRHENRQISRCRRLSEMYVRSNC